MLANDEIIQRVLELQEEGHTRKEIQTLIGFEKLTELTKFMREHGYDKNGEQYVCRTDVGQISHEKVSEEVQETVVGQLSDNDKEIDSDAPLEGQIAFDETKQEVSETGVGQMSDTVIDMQTNDLKHNLIGLAENYEELMSMLKWYRTGVGQVSDNSSRIIEVIAPGIQIDLPEAENIKTSIRVNQVVWDEFGTFAEQHKAFNKSDLLAQALKEFMKKYND